VKRNMMAREMKKFVKRNMMAREMKTIECKNVNSEYSINNTFSDLLRK
jgi:hypothetical protein